MTQAHLIERFVLFGATGDLAARHVLPAFAALHAVGELPEAFRIVATGRSHTTTTRSGAASRITYASTHRRSPPGAGTPLLRPADIDRST